MSQPTPSELAHAKVEALLRMLEEDGATPAGELPPKDHLEALNQAYDGGQALEVAHAHRDENAPPDGIGRKPHERGKAPQGPPVDQSNGGDG